MFWFQTSQHYVHQPGEKRPPYMKFECLISKLRYLKALRKCDDRLSKRERMLSHPPQTAQDTLHHVFTRNQFCLRNITNHHSPFSSRPFVHFEGPYKRYKQARLSENDLNGLEMWQSMWGYTSGYMCGTFIDFGRRQVVHVLHHSWQHIGAFGTPNAMSTQKISNSKWIFDHPSVGHSYLETSVFNGWIVIILLWLNSLPMFYPCELGPAAFVNMDGLRPESDKVNLIWLEKAQSQEAVCGAVVRCEIVE